MADPRKSTAGELAVQFVKEAASGAFSSGRGRKGSAGRAGEVLKARARAPEGLTVDTNTYRDRQTTDSNNP
jgi:hypothetical protein